MPLPNCNTQFSISKMFIKTWYLVVLCGSLKTSINNMGDHHVFGHVLSLFSVLHFKCTPTEFTAYLLLYSTLQVTIFFTTFQFHLLFSQYFTQSMCILSACLRLVVTRMFLLTDCTYFLILFLLIKCVTSAYSIKWKS